MQDVRTKIDTILHILHRYGTSLQASGPSTMLYLAPFSYSGSDGTSLTLFGLAVNGMGSSAPSAPYLLALPSQAPAPVPSLSPPR